MAVHKRKIESFRIILQSEDEIDFGKLITNKICADNEKKIAGKRVSLNIIKNSKEYIVGLVETTRNENVPPKKNTKNKKISPLGLSADEGLAYANVFLFEKRRGIIMYEVNKFGCFINHFLEYIYKCYKKAEDIAAFNIELSPVLKANEYRRMLDMRFHKSLEIKIANPSEILKDYNHKNDALWNLFVDAKKIHSERVTTKYEVSARGHSTGLASNSLKSIVDRLLEIANGPHGKDVEKIEVVGYLQDSDEGLAPIDLIADRFGAEIELDEPRENSDLLEFQRQSQIIALYKASISEFDEIFG